MAISFIGGTPPGRGDGTLEKHSEGRYVPATLDSRRTQCFGLPSPSRRIDRVHTGRGASAAAPAQALCTGRDHAAGRIGRRKLRRVPRGARRQSQAPHLRRACAARAGAGLLSGTATSVRTFDPRKPAVDNLAAAIALEQGNGAGWDTLAAFAAEATVEPLESRPGVVCAPARPAMTASRSPSCSTPPYDRHRLGLSPDEKTCRCARPTARRGIAGYIAGGTSAPLGIEPAGRNTDLF